MAFFLVTMVTGGPSLKPLKTLNTFKITSIELPHRSIHYHVCSRGLHHNEVYLDERHRIQIRTRTETVIANPFVFLCSNPSVVIFHQMEYQFLNVTQAQVQFSTITTPWQTPHGLIWLEIVQGKKKITAVEKAKSERRKATFGVYSIQYLSLSLHF